MSRAFPAAYARDVERAARFWELLGFERFYELTSPADPDGNPVALCAEPGRS